MTKIYILIFKELIQINEKNPNGKMGKGDRLFTEER